MILLAGFLAWKTDLRWWCREVCWVCISVAAQPSAAITEETDIQTRTKSGLAQKKPQKKRRFPFLKEAPFFQASSIAFCQQDRKSVV